MRRTIPTEHLIHLVENSEKTLELYFDTYYSPKWYTEIKFNLRNDTFCGTNIFSPSFLAPLSVTELRLKQLGLQKYVFTSYT